MRNPGAWRPLAPLLVVVALVLIGRYVVLGGADRAQVVGTVVEFGVIGMGVVRWWFSRRVRAQPSGSSPEQVAAAADRLAKETLRTWLKTAVERGIEQSAPVRVHWSWADEEVGLPRARLVATARLASDPPPLPGVSRGKGKLLEGGLVTRLHEQVYARLDHGRLIVTGGPGAGKTGAMILLLLEALRHRLDMRLTAGQRAGVPVPVWLTLGSWNPVSESLRVWVATTLARDHPYLRAPEFGPTAIAELIEDGRVALFLDGLDEMPEALRGRAIQRLNEEAPRLRVVLASRPVEFQATLEGHDVLHYSAVVHLQPVGAGDAVAYLLDGRHGDARRSWQQVTRLISADPAGVLARTLRTPLTLSLARSAYEHADPVELLAPGLDSADALLGHLLDQVLVRAYPDPDDRRHAQYWLGWLAHHMNHPPTGPTRDLSWWHIPTFIPRRRFRLATVFLAAVSFGPALGLIAGLGIGRAVGVTAGLIAGTAGVVIGALAGAATGGLAASGAPPRRTVIRWPALRELRTGLGTLLIDVMGGISIGLMFGLAGGVIGGSIVGYAPGLVGGLAGGVVGGIAGGIAFWLLYDVWVHPIGTAEDITPQFVYRQDIATQRLSALTVGLLGGLTGGLVGGVVASFSIGPALALPVGLGIGLLIGFPVALVVQILFGFQEGGAYPLFITETALRLSGRRVRFIALLETALRKQVLRQAGAVYQFRHAELQDRLANGFRDS